MKIKNFFFIKLSLALALAVISLSRLSASEYSSVSTDLMVQEGSSAAVSTAPNHSSNVVTIEQQGTTVITAGQYSQFLNAVGKSDLNYLYDHKLETDSTVANIFQWGTPGNYFYTVDPQDENLPVKYVDEASAMRFCNWMQNGQPAGLQGSATTEEGAYTLDGPTADKDGDEIAINSNATYYLSSEANEGLSFFKSSNVGFSVTANNADLVLRLMPSSSEKENSSNSTVKKMGAAAILILGAVTMVGGHGFEEEQQPPPSEISTTAVVRPSELQAHSAVLSRNEHLGVEEKAQSIVSCPSVQPGLESSLAKMSINESSAIPQAPSTADQKMMSDLQTRIAKCVKMSREAFVLAKEASGNYQKIFHTHEANYWKYAAGIFNDAAGLFETEQRMTRYPLLLEAGRNLEIVAACYYNAAHISVSQGIDESELWFAAARKFDKVAQACKQASENSGNPEAFDKIVQAGSSHEHAAKAIVRFTKDTTKENRKMFAAADQKFEQWTPANVASKKVNISHMEGAALIASEEAHEIYATLLDSTRDMEARLAIRDSAIATALQARNSWGKVAAELRCVLEKQQTPESIRSWLMTTTTKTEREKADWTYRLLYLHVPKAPGSGREADNYDPAGPEAELHEKFMPYAGLVDEIREAQGDPKNPINIFILQPDLPDAEKKPAAAFGGTQEASSDPVHEVYVNGCLVQAFPDRIVLHPALSDEVGVSEKAVASSNVEGSKK